jgi:neurotransmitter:Na+ symporter, NSS family
MEMLKMQKNQQRDQWASKIGLVLAMAGNAVGLGNFLRFPMQTAQNGGGAFMIPYFIAFVFLGLPLMFVEWGMGRFGGGRGHATMPGIMALIKNNKFFRILGAIGVWLPLIVVSYYTFIESWTLGYAVLSMLGKFAPGIEPEYVRTFFTNYQNISLSNPYPYILFLITMGLNGFILYRGISQGIEKAAKILMPLLFFFAIALVVRVFTLGTPDPQNPDWNVVNGLGFIWNPDFSQMSQFRIWVAAAGQIFFTLSLGMGCIACYASYVKKDDDVVASGISTALTNEVCEVILGASIAIPLAVAFFGMQGAREVALTSGFGLGFVTMPLLFAKIPMGSLFGSLWFLLLFFAGITSSIAMGQVVVAFFEEIVGMPRKKAVLFTLGVVFLLAHLAIFVKGGLDEMDTIASTLALTFFALVEIFIWVHVFGIEQSWNELMQGAKLKLWIGFKFLSAYVAPVFIATILIGWLVQDGKKWFLATDNAAGALNIWIVRGVLILVFVLIGWLSTRNMHKTDLNHREEAA